MAGQKNIVVLGGSYAGMSITHNLLKHVLPVLPEASTYTVTIVAASETGFCRPACPRALISDELINQEKLFFSVTKQFNYAPKGSFQFIHGTATELDHTARSVSITLPNGAVQKLEFYAIVLATGASTSSPLLSMKGDVGELKAEWAAFREALPAAKTIVVAGGGPAGVETAGELGEYLNGRAGWFSSQPSQPKAEITVLTSDGKILPLLRQSIAEKAEKYLAKVGVKVLHNARVASVVPEGAGVTNVATKTTVTLADGKTLEADLYIPAFGYKPNTAYVNKSLLVSDGRVDVNAGTFRAEKAGARIYAIGDVASGARPAVHNILDTIPVLTHNIKRDLLLASGKESGAPPADQVFEEDTREMQMVPIGKSKGVGAAMGYALPSWLVWAVKGRDYWLWTVGKLWSGGQWNKEKFP